MGCYYKLIKTLGYLKVQEVQEAEIKNLPFAGKLVTKEMWQDYGTRYIKELDLLTSGNLDDIVIGDYTFSGIIDISAKYLSGCQEYSYTFRIEYLGSDGYKKEFRADNRTSSELIDVVYAIILIVTLKNLDSVKSLWNIRDITISNVDTTLKQLYDAKENAQKAIAEYPVIRQFLKEEIKIAVDKFNNKMQETALEIEL